MKNTSRIVQTGSGDHTVSYWAGKWVISWGQGSRSM